MNQKRREDPHRRSPPSLHASRVAAMADEALDQPPDATPSPTPATPPVPATPSPTVLLRPRREAFEHGLLPIPKLIFPEGTLAQTLAQLKEKLAASAPDGRVRAAALAEALQIPQEQAALALATLAAVLPAEDPALGDGAVDGSAADIRDMLLFLYIQSYKRLVPRSAHKDSPVVADVWPSTSAFDGYLSALSPIQLVRSNSRRFMPSQADEEIHQLSYLQKHMANILTLLADSVEGDGDDSLVLNCHDSVIYILAPLKYATVYGCSDATVVLGAVGKVVKVEHCERVHIIAAAKRICIANCRECIFYIGVNHQPLVLGDNHKLQVAPFNTCYPQLHEHMIQVAVDPSVNKWDQPFVLGVVDPHDSLSHPAGVSDVKAESATCLDPDLFTNFLIPSWFGDERQGTTNRNPFPLPEIYGTSQSKKRSALEDIQKMIRELQLDENRKRELATALHVQFKDWLYASGNIRQLYCLQGD
ncbi:Tubulin binding cofactor C domain-containing protein [Zea mays]|uniref:TBCC domain-containing protein 1 n=1 Tax=Zea mays TaxID=4577 RepID=A0A1D6QRF1_MAIZE|nr:Tubulin binding cofactor C domain-containing protein [Zea mays]